MAQEMIFSVSERVSLLLCLGDFGSLCGNRNSRGYMNQVKLCIKGVCKRVDVVTRRE